MPIPPMAPEIQKPFIFIFLPYFCTRNSLCKEMSVNISHFANSVSFTKQFQNRDHAAKQRQAESKKRSASSPYHRNHLRSLKSYMLGSQNWFRTSETCNSEQDAGPNPFMTILARTGLTGMSLTSVRAWATCVLFSALALGP